MPKENKKEAPQEQANNVDLEKTLILNYLGECPVCGYAPPPELAEADAKQSWVAFPSPVPGVWFIICPSCFSIHVNPNYVENMVKFRNMQEEKRIITPNEESRIVVPGLGKVRK